MYFFAERSQTPKTPWYFWNGAALCLGAVALVAGSFAGLSRGRSPNWAGIFLFMLVALAMRLLAGQKRNGIYPSLCLMMTVGAHLCFGSWGVVIVGFGAVAGAEILRPLLAGTLELERHTVGQSVVSVALVGGAVVIAVLSGVRLYATLGGDLPLMALLADDIVPLAGLFAVSYLVHFALLVLAYTVAYGFPGAAGIWQLLRVTVLSEFILLPFGMVLALLFHRLEWINFVGVLVFLVGSIVLQRTTEINRNRLEGRVRELAMINGFAQAISNDLSLEALLKTVYAEMRDLVPLELFVVSLFDAITNTWSFPLVMQNDQRQEWTALAVTRSLGLYMYRMRMPLLINGDVTAGLLQLGIDEKLHPPQPTSLLCLPLVSANQVIGTISLECVSGTFTYAQSQVDLLMTLMPQVAASLHNALLYKRTSSMANDLVRINEISSIISGSLDLNKILDTVCETLQRIMGASKAGVFLIDTQRSLAQMVYSVGFSDEGRALFASLPATSELVDAMQPFAIADVRIDPRGLGWRTLAEIGSYVAMTFAPLRTQERLIGQLAVFYDDVHVFTDAELKLLETVANQVAVAVSNARLYQETQRRADEMMELVETSHALIESFEMANVGAVSVGRLQSVLQLDETLLYSWEAETEQLIPLASATHRALALTPEQTAVLQRAIQGKHAVELPERADDLNFLQSFGLRYALLMPLVLRSEVTGVALLGRAQAELLQAHDRRFAEALLNQTATVLDNARLFRLIDTELDERIQQLSAIESMSRRMSASFDREQLMRELLTAALTTGDVDKVTITLRNAPDAFYILEQVRTEAMPHALEVREVQDGSAEVLRTGNVVMRNAQREPFNELHVPITVSGETIGVISVHSVYIANFNPAHLSFLTTLAEHAAVALEKARLFSAVRRSSDEMRAIINAVDDGMVLVGAKGEILQANRAAQRLFNAPEADYIGRNAIRYLAGGYHGQRALSYPPDALRTLLRNARNQPAEVTRQSYRISLADGQRDIAEAAIPVFNDAGEIISRLFILHDATQANELERFKEDLFETVVHDLRSPLGSVITSLHMAQDYAGQSDLNAVQKVLPSSLMLSNDLLALVNTILDVRKLESGKLTLDRELTPLRYPVERAIQIVEAPAHAAEIQLLDLLPHDLPPLSIDSSKLRRVFVNLLDNAIKFTPDHGQVRVTAALSPDLVTVSVTDTGSGIPAEYRDKVFEMFTTVPKQVSAGRRRGTGIGLTFCRLVVEAHGGHIWVDDGPEGGAAIHFTLPLMEAAPTPETASQTTAAG